MIALVLPALKALIYVNQAWSKERLTSLLSEETIVHVVPPSLTFLLSQRRSSPCNGSLQEFPSVLRQRRCTWVRASVQH